MTMHASFSAKKTQEACHAGAQLAVPLCPMQPLYVSLPVALSVYNRRILLASSFLSVHDWHSRKWIFFNEGKQVTTAYVLIGNPQVLARFHWIFFTGLHIACACACFFVIMDFTCAVVCIIGVSHMFYPAVAPLPTVITGCSQPK